MKTVIDGTSHAGCQTGGPEMKAPYFVFCPDSQMNRAGPFNWKWQARLWILLNTVYA